MVFQKLKTNLAISLHDHETEEYIVEEKKVSIEHKIFEYLKDIKHGIIYNELQREHLINLKIIIVENKLHLKFPNIQQIIDEVLSFIENKLNEYNYNTSNSSK